MPKYEDGRISGLGWYTAEEKEELDEVAEAVLALFAARGLSHREAVHLCEDRIPAALADLPVRPANPGPPANGNA